MNTTPARITLNLGAAYLFTVLTAVACGKVDSASVIKAGTARGQATIGQGYVTPANEQSVTITKTASFAADSEMDGYQTTISIGATHGTRALDFNVFPEGNVADGVQQTVGSIDYTAQGMCFDGDCSKFAVMLTITDNSNGTVFQRAQYIENQSLSKSVANTRFSTVAEAYAYMVSPSVISAK